MAFRIVTDSATDMPQEIREKYQLHVIPTPFILNGVDHLDGDEITREAFYNYLDDDKNVITTEGIIIRMNVEDISTLGRITSGVKLIDMEKDIRVASIAKVRESSKESDEQILLDLEEESEK